MEAEAGKRRNGGGHHTVFGARVGMVSRSDNGYERAEMSELFDKKTAEELAGNHDVRLSQWGPYTKRYMGISHLPAIETGLRFDLSVFPIFSGRKNFVPKVHADSGYHPWKAAPDLSYYVHRHEMIWKDMLYVDIAYLRASENQVFVRAHFVNNTELARNVGLSYLSSIHFPPAKTYSNVPLDTFAVILPEGGQWLDAMDYRELSPRPGDNKDNLVWDGHRRGEAYRQPQGLVNGTGLLLGPWEEDTVTYSLAALPLGDPLCTVIRYRSLGDRVRLTVNQADVNLPAAADFETCVISLDGAGKDGLTLVCKEGKAIIDGFAFVRPDQVGEVRFTPVHKNTVATRVENEHSMCLSYEPIDDVYGIAWDPGPFQITHHSGDDVDKLYAEGKVDGYWDDDDAGSSGRWTSLIIKPLSMAPSTSLTHFGMIVNGPDVEVQDALSKWADEKKSLPARFAEAEKGANILSTNPSGETYLFSQERMAATMLTNVVYPIRTRGTWIRHYTPGRKWDCLYTWDSGFVGLGLAELDLNRSLDNLNAYVTEPGTRDAEGAAFLHHGTPLPVQHYQFLELWNRTQDHGLAAYFYPRLRQFHRFLAGHDGGSTTRTLKSNLLRTWDYFYNSGGWDDYPAQVHAHRQRLTRCATPVVNTAHAIRTARILKMIASELGEPTDEFDADVAMFTEALQTHSWDEESGYFSYVLHDDHGTPTGHLMHADGQNFNMGLDGVAPLVSGICTPEQEAALVDRLMDPERIWSCCGLSTVDQSAVYYSDYGYWNGSVWMPHQWFLWKALLSLGYGEQAWRIAHTGLETWKREVEDSYNCYELFNVKTGRGGAWHHFGGLSSPVLCWFNAYHAPKRLTVGLDTYVSRLEANDTSIDADLRQFGCSRHKPVVLAVLIPDGSWSVTFNGQPCSWVERIPGTLEISLPSGKENGRLLIQRSGSDRSSRC